MKSALYSKSTLLPACNDGDIKWPSDLELVFSSDVIVTVSHCRI